MCGKVRTRIGDLVDIETTRPGNTRRQKLRARIAPIPGREYGGVQHHQVASAQFRSEPVGANQRIHGASSARERTRRNSPANPRAVLHMDGGAMDFPAAAHARRTGARRGRRSIGAARRFAGPGHRLTLPVVAGRRMSRGRLRARRNQASDAAAGPARAAIRSGHGYRHARAACQSSWRARKRRVWPPAGRRRSRARFRAG